jgi:hypothetical protein
LEHADPTEKANWPCHSFGYRLFPVLLAISCIALTITIVIYLVIPEFNSLPGKILLRLCVSLLTAKVLLIFLQVTHSPHLKSVIIDIFQANSWMTELRHLTFFSSFCSALSILLQFSFISAFSWMTVMSLDLCHSFCHLNTARSKRRLTRSVSRPDHGKERVRLWLYSGLGWGAPGLLSAATLALEYALPPGPLRPNFGSLRPNGSQDTCWFSGNLQILLYFYGPIGAMVLVNMITYFITIISLYR